MSSLDSMMMVLNCLCGDILNFFYWVGLCVGWLVELNVDWGIWCICIDYVGEFLGCRVGMVLFCFV